MLYKTYLMTSILALALFGWAQYHGLSLFSEEGDTSHSASHTSSGGHYSGGSHRGTYHK